MEIYIWLVLTIVFIVFELVTVGLVSIWFAAGSLGALIAAFFGGNIIVQLVVFVILSGALLILTRPWADRHINKKMIKTNVESVVGKTAVLTQAVDNMAQTGKLMLAGQEWSVRGIDEEPQIEEGALVSVVAVSGVKLIVERVKEN